MAYHPFNLDEENDTSDIVRFEPVRLIFPAHFYNECIVSICASNLQAMLFGSEVEDLFDIYIGSDECYVLEFEIKNIVFTHHPLFCREHVLANKLSQLFEKYQFRLNAAITKRLASKLKALRTAHDNLKKIIQTEENEDMVTVHRERLNR